MFEELEITLIRLTDKGISYLPELWSGSGGDWPPNRQDQSCQVDDTKERESLHH